MRGIGLNIPGGALLLVLFLVVMALPASCGRRADPVYVPAHDQKEPGKESAVPAEKARQKTPRTPPAPEATETAEPDAPEGLVGMYTGRSVVLTWQGVRRQGVKSYRIYRSSGGTFELTGETPTPAFTDRDVAQGLLYRYYVTAVGKAEGPPSAEIGILTEVE